MCSTCDFSLILTVPSTLNLPLLLNIDQLIYPIDVAINTILITLTPSSNSLVIQIFSKIYDIFYTSYFFRFLNKKYVV